MNQTVFVLAAVLNSLLIGCDLGSQPENQPTTIVAEGISYTLSLERVIFRLADSVSGELIVRNVLPTSVELQFPNQHALRWRLLNQADQEVLTFPTGWFPAFSYLRLSSGETKVYTFRFALRDRHNVALDPGVYRFQARLDREGSPYLQKEIHVQ
jgi:hypothetical protein